MGESKEVKAACAMSASFGIEILDVEHGTTEKVAWRWPGEKKIHKSRVQETADGKLRFRANRQWILLDECMAVS